MEKKKKSDKRPIAYQNKDITSKVLAEEFVGKTFAVYGIDVPKIVDTMPTELPAIEVNELKLDNLFRLEDGSIALVDYESSYRERNKIKYLGYVARVLKRLYNKEKQFPVLKIIVIYTANVKRGTTNPELNLEGIHLQLTEAFLSDIESAGIWKEIKEAILHNHISDEIAMKMIIYPLTFVSIKGKRNAVSRVIDLTETIPDGNRKRFILAGLQAFSDKIIREEDAERIRRILSMTKVGKLFMDEMDEAVRKEHEKGEQAMQKKQEAIALNLLRENTSMQKVARCTELPIQVVKQLKAGLL